MRVDVVSIFPDYLAPLDLSLIGKAREDGLLDVRVHDLRDFTHDRHRTVDDTPYGGGAGMVMKPQPWAEALDHVLAQGDPEGAKPRLVVPGPGGQPFTQALARELAQEPWLAFACGRYEGIDERVYDHAREDLGPRGLGRQPRRLRPQRRRPVGTLPRFRSPSGSRRPRPSRSAAPRDASPATGRTSRSRSPRARVSTIFVVTAPSFSVGTARLNSWAAFASETGGLT